LIPRSLCNNLAQSLLPTALYPRSTSELRSYSSLKFCLTLLEWKEPTNNRETSKPRWRLSTIFLQQILLKNRVIFQLCLTAVCSNEPGRAFSKALNGSILNSLISPGSRLLIPRSVSLSSKSLIQVLIILLCQTRRSTLRDIILALSILDERSCPLPRVLEKELEALLITHSIVFHASNQEISKTKKLSRSPRTSKAHFGSALYTFLKYCHKPESFCIILRSVSG
jgi:hypothetical protein